MNLDAMTLPKDRLLDALQARIARPPAGGVRITSYMENIGWPELFGFNMNRFLTDPAFSLEMQLRQKIFWADNAADDSTPDLDVQATTGMYFDMTLFGEHIHHTADGVPQFEPHPIAQNPDPASIAPFNFYTTGEMPALIEMYRRMNDLNARDYDGQLQVSFPNFHRGPLDALVQLRGYDHFIADTAERPEMVEAFLRLFADARLKFACERAHFLGLPGLPPTTFVADDWVNVPFISPAMFRRFVAPVYRHIVVNEGPVTGFHTCGHMELVVQDLLAAFPDIQHLEVSGWNDLALLDRIVSPQVGFDIAVINTLVLAGSESEQREKLEAVAAVSRHRPVTLCAQAMVKLDSYDETLARLNRFLVLARQILNGSITRRDS
jgi:hypothetical protein